MTKTSLKDISGQTFGKWTVVSRAPHKAHWKNRAAQWNVRCACGNESVIAGTELRKASPSKSCGCGRIGPQPKRVGKYSRDQHHAWKGGKILDKKGYISLTTSQVLDMYPSAQWPDGHKSHKMFEHRAAMSHHLKRALFKDETVHHKNGNRSDNRLENLELHAGKHGPGQSISDLIQWATEILNRYGKEPKRRAKGITS